MADGFFVGGFGGGMEPEAASSAPAERATQVDANQSVIDYVLDVFGGKSNEAASPSTPAADTGITGAYQALEQQISALQNNASPTASDAATALNASNDFFREGLTAAGKDPELQEKLVKSVIANGGAEKTEEHIHALEAMRDKATDDKLKTALSENIELLQQQQQMVDTYLAGYAKGAGISATGKELEQEFAKREGLDGVSGDQAKAELFETLKEKTALKDIETPALSAEIARLEGAEAAATAETEHGKDAERGPSLDDKVATTASSKEDYKEAVAALAAAQQAGITLNEFDKLTPHLETIETHLSEKEKDGSLSKSESVMLENTRQLRDPASKADVETTLSAIQSQYQESRREEYQQALTALQNMRDDSGNISPSEYKAAGAHLAVVESYLQDEQKTRDLSDDEKTLLATTQDIISDKASLKEGLAQLDGPASRIEQAATLAQQGAGVGSVGVAGMDALHADAAIGAGVGVLTQGSQQQPAAATDLEATAALSPGAGIGGVGVAGATLAQGATRSVADGIAQSNAQEVQIAQDLAKQAEEAAKEASKTAGGENIQILADGHKAANDTLKALDNNGTEAAKQQVETEQLRERKIGELKQSLDQQPELSNERKQAIMQEAAVAQNPQQIDTIKAQQANAQEEEKKEKEQEPNAAQAALIAATAMLTTGMPLVGAVGIANAAASGNFLEQARQVGAQLNGYMAGLNMKNAPLPQEKGALAQTQGEGQVRS